MTEILKNWIVKNLLLAVGLIIVLVLVSALGLNLITHHGRELVVPDFTNMKVSEAQYTAAVEDMRIEIVDSVYIRRMGRGLIYSQNPKPGAKVKKGRRILLTINSVTPKKVQMPNLVGYSMRQAKAWGNASAMGICTSSLSKLVRSSDCTVSTAVICVVLSVELVWSSRFCVR